MSKSEIRVYSLNDYAGEPQLEALLTRRQFELAMESHLIRMDREAGIYRVTAAGDAALNDPDTTYRG